MPSSTNRSSSIERSLYAYYKAIHYRMVSADRYLEDHFLTERFAELLDLTPHQLLNSMPEVTLAGWDEDDDFTGCKEIRDERDHWERMKIRWSALKGSENVWQAADLLSNVAELLGIRGRIKAAVEWSQWSQELHQVGNKMWIQEEAEKQWVETIEID
jgi:hypothetical protein